MTGLLKTLLGIMLTAGIFIGVAAFVADQNPLGSSPYYGRDGLCGRDNGYATDSSSERQRAACYEMMRRRHDSAEAQERWLGMGLGAGAVGLFWFLAYIVYVRQRKRTVQADQADAGQPAPEPGPITRLWPWHVGMLIFFSVGFFVFDNQYRTIQRNAERATESCLLAKALAAGQDPASYDPPSEAVSECYGPQRDAMGSSGPYYVGGGAGLVAALVFLAIVLGWRRATGTRAET